MHSQYLHIHATYKIKMFLLHLYFLNNQNIFLTYTKTQFKHNSLAVYIA